MRQTLELRVTLDYDSPWPFNEDTTAIVKRAVLDALIAENLDVMDAVKEQVQVGAEKVYGLSTPGEDLAGGAAETEGGDIDLLWDDGYRGDDENSGRTPERLTAALRLDTHGLGVMVSRQGVLVGDVAVELYRGELRALVWPDHQIGDDPEITTLHDLWEPAPGKDD